MKISQLDDDEAHGQVTLEGVLPVIALSFAVNLASITGAQDVVTAITPGFKGEIMDLDFSVNVPATTSAKAVTLNAEIGTTNVTGGEVALTSANCTPMGATIAAAAITAANASPLTDARRWGC